MNAIDILLIVILAQRETVTPIRLLYAKAPTVSAPREHFPGKRHPFFKRKARALKGRGLFVCRNGGGVRRPGAAFPRIIG